jgi:hypothetical protein
MAAVRMHIDTVPPKGDAYISPSILKRLEWCAYVGAGGSMHLNCISSIWDAHQNPQTNGSSIGIFAAARSLQSS